MRRTVLAPALIAWCVLTAAAQAPGVLHIRVTVLDANKNVVPVAGYYRRRRRWLPPAGHNRPEVPPLDKRTR